MRTFISYQNEDEAFARVLGRHLADRGHTVAFYPYRLADPISVIAEELRRADLLLLTVGSNTSKSIWVAAEILAAQVRTVPMLAILLDEESTAPLTLPIKTPIVAYPSLAKTDFALFDIFPSRRMRAKRWADIRRKISPYRHPYKDTIPPPIIDRASITNVLLLIVGLACMAISYLIGFFLPWFVMVTVQILKGRGSPCFVSISKLDIPIFLAWQCIFFLILFYKPRQRLVYPLWILWFFRDYVPAWLSIRAATVRSEMKQVMCRLSNSPGNRAYWEQEQRCREGDRSPGPGGHATKDLFSLLSVDERRSGPHGEFDEKGLSQINTLILSIPDFDLGRYGRSVVVLKRSPEEIDVISPQCPAPFCLCGKVVRLQKRGNEWQVVSRNW